MRNTRLDFLKMDSVEVTPQGFLRFPVYAGRTGVQVYRGPDGQLIREFRPPEEVFSEKTLSSLKGIVVTNEHPPEMVNLDNVEKYQKGFGSDQVEVVDNKYQKTFVTVTDKELIQQIQNGKVEVSLGYDVQLEDAKGEFEGMPYDAIQRNIINNHLAIVTKGRAGREVALRLDHFDGIMFDENKTEDSLMTKLMVKDEEFEVAEAVAEAFMELTETVKELEEKLEESKEKVAEEISSEEMPESEKESEESEEMTMDEMKKMLAEKDSEMEKMKADMEEMKKDYCEKKEMDMKENKMDSDTIHKLVIERKNLEKVAEKFLSEDKLAKLDSMDSNEIKKAVILNSTKKEINLADKSQDYINARFDSIVEIYSTKETKTVETRNDSKSSADIRKENMMKASEAWKNPVGKTLNK